MALLIGQIIHNGKALTGTLRLAGESSTDIETLNGYFEQTEIAPGKYQALLIANEPEGVVPEFRVEIPDTPQVAWADLFAKPKARRLPAIASQPPTNQPIDSDQVERLRRIPPPNPNPREGSEQSPDYWQREEFLQPATEDGEELVEEEVAIAPPPLDRKTKLLLEMAARRRK